MAATLFFRKVAPSEIKGLAYHELKYWSNWIEYEQSKTNKE
jgi:hypothetical protein